MGKASATYAQLQLAQSKCAERNKEIKACICASQASMLIELSFQQRNTGQCIKCEQQTTEYAEKETR
jgi:hypothetical protein